MSNPKPSAARFPLAALIVIGGVVGVSAGAFAYTAGWLSPNRLTPTKIVDSLAPPGGPALGHRRNHTKGICFTGEFQANGAGVALSSAAVFEKGSYAAIGRFNLASAELGVADGRVPIRGLGLQIAAPTATWRMAMITAPFFPVANPQGFYDLQVASHSKAPDAMKGFIAAHPEFVHFVGWLKGASWNGSYAEDRFNSLDSFAFTNTAGQRNIVRWSWIPAAPAVATTPAALMQQGPNALETDIAARVAQAPQKWELVVTVANPGDPTNDPSKAWPDDRRSLDVGTLIVQKVEAEPDGPCRDLNFDPTVLPSGISTSDDPFPAARSAAYAVSYNRRTAEAADYPRTVAGETP